MYIRDLKKLREQKGLSQTQCAEATGIPVRTLQRYENGGSIGDTEYLCRLMDLFEISASDLVNDIGER